MSNKNSKGFGKKGNNNTVKDEEYTNYGESKIKGRRKTVTYSAPGLQVLRKIGSRMFDCFGSRNSNPPINLKGEVVNFPDGYYYLFNDNPPIIEIGTDNYDEMLTIMSKKELLF